MDENMTELRDAFIDLLKGLKVPKEEATALCVLLKTDKMKLEAYYGLKAGNFKQTPQEAMRICAEVIMKYQET